MRPKRRNSDEDLRSLIAAIRQGDDAALQRFANEARRQDLPEATLRQAWQAVVDRQHDIRGVGHPSPYEQWKALDEWAEAAYSLQILMTRQALREGWDRPWHQAEYKPPRVWNPSLGATWLTPQVEARLRDLERRLIRTLTKKYGPEEGVQCCREAASEALGIVEKASGLTGLVFSGIVLYPKDPEGWPNEDWTKLDRAYHHYWVVLNDGTIVDAAVAQFGERGPLVIPPGHPLQRRYVPEHRTAEELESGAVPLDLERWEKSTRWAKRRNMASDDRLRELAQEIKTTLDASLVKRFWREAVRTPTLETFSVLADLRGWAQDQVWRLHGKREATDVRRWDLLDEVRDELVHAWSMVETEILKAAPRSEWPEIREQIAAIVRTAKERYNLFRKHPLNFDYPEDPS